MTDQPNWSTSEDEKLAEMWLAYDDPLSMREIADELRKSKSSVNRRISALGFRGRKGDRALYEQWTGVALDPVIKPVRVQTPTGPSGQQLPTSYTMLVWGDTQYPYHDPKAVDVLYQITRDLKPEVLVCLGDIFDFAEISAHRPPESTQEIQESLNQGVAHLAKMTELAEPSEAFFLAGNHEDRWDRLLTQTQKDVRLRQLMQIPSIKKSLQFEEVAGFADLGYEYIPYTAKSAGSHQAKVFHDKLVIIHGDRSNKWAARSMLDRYGKSVIFGHTHRIQNFTRRDLKGQESAWNIGCLCLLDQHYTKFTDWGHAFAVVEWSEIDGEWYFNVEVVRIHDGISIFRDKTYTATD